jgi:hypothetical protein
VDFTGGGGNGAARRAMARDGVRVREAQGGLKYQRARLTMADNVEASPCYGGSTGMRTAGAADGPGVRHAHGAVRRRGRRDSRRPRAERASGHVDLGQHTPRAGGASGRCVGARLPRVGRHQPATRGARARDVAACWRPALTVSLALPLNSNFSKFFNITRPSFEHES